MGKNEICDYVAYTKCSELDGKGSFEMCVVIYNSDGCETFRDRRAVRQTSSHHAQMVAVLTAARHIPRFTRAVIYTASEVVACVYMGIMRANKDRQLVNEFQIVRWESLAVRWKASDELKAKIKKAFAPVRHKPKKVAPPKDRPALFWFEAEEKDEETLERMEEDLLQDGLPF